MAVGAVVSVVLKKLTNLLNEEPEIFEKVRDEVERVVNELKEIQSTLNDAEHQSQQGEKVLTDWVMQFLGKVYRVEDAIESFVLSQTHLKRMGFVKKQVSVFLNEIKLCREIPDHSENFGRIKDKMTGIGKEIQEWKSGKPSLAPLWPLQDSQATPRQDQPWRDSDAYYATKKEETIFKKDVEKLVNQLTRNSKPLQIISVFGEVGSGKTAHIRTIYNKLEVKKRFTCRALVTLGPKCSVKHVMVDILQQITMTSLKGKERLKEEDLIGKVYDFLKGEKYLIVVIDVKSADLLKQLRVALPDTNNGSRVVITTPEEEVASYPDATSHYHFKPLDMEDGLKFFIKKVWGPKAIPFPGDVMEDLKNKIAERCKGIPLRIIMLAGLLSTRKVMYEDWLTVFKQHDFATKSPSVDILAFCYNDLSLHLKLCFLYLGLFQKGYEIPVRRLFRLWLAEGFVKPPSEGVILEDIVEGYLEELVNRNMVEITKRRSDESPKKCRMIGVLHDIFLPRSVEIGFFHLHQKLDENSNAAEPQFGVRRVVEYTNIKDYPTSKAFNQNLQSYISFNGRKKDMPADEVGTFLERIIGARGFGLLKVLDLEGVYRPRLPENLGNLFHLRYLGLRWTFLDTLPSSLGALLYLETLDIKHTHISTLPSSIWNMNRLRHLCLNGARLDISVQSTKNRALSQLQTLCGLFVDEKIARKIGLTLSRMTNLRKLDMTRQSSSTTMTITTITKTTTTTTTTRQSSSYAEIGQWISSLSSLQSLRLRSKDKMGWPSELIIEPFSNLKNLSQLYLLGTLHQSLDWYQIPPGLKVLTLSVSHLDKDPMPTLSQLPSLIVLRLLATSYVGEEMCCPENGFPALQVLKLWKLERLKVWTAHGGTMQNLHTLEIRCCRELEELPVTLLQIQTFDNLILTNMPKSFVSAVRKKKKKHTKIVEYE